MELLFDFDQVLGKLDDAKLARPDIEWAEALEPPIDAKDFALELAFVICNSGMRFTVARRIYDRVRHSLMNGHGAQAVFKHSGKAASIDHIWCHRGRLLREYRASEDKLAFLEDLPWIGPVTKFHAAKNFGLQVAKPDVHMQRLADLHSASPHDLCEYLAGVTGYKLATIDTLLWRACAVGILDSRTGRIAK